MFFFESPWRDPYYNLALEEYLFQSLNRKHDYLMLWQNENSIIVGKYQNTAEEINQSYVDANGIKVARRLSGGGAVYHDLGNLNYTLITSPDNLEEFKVLC
jgi:lipoate-protein ligase A